MWCKDAADLQTGSNSFHSMRLDVHGVWDDDAGLFISVSFHSNLTFVRFSPLRVETMQSFEKCVTLLS